ncbi:MAG: SelT/SelW/SelH family protein [Candidatus Dadabacteria bacterium]|nr:SelT/SelW/SelH family protein [Candidatus Dadabacteria bacterium]NIV42921.1 SelT/SelW/SelH family protein [Candidatus Dadabacteria bacterium]NIX14885.1 SelT/SelW/SelH family protein [Candidatus Dadabacteria bacterium]
MSHKYKIQIEYCTQCKWLIRAAWIAQELLTTFEAELGEVSLIPGKGGIFQIRTENKILWDRKEQDGVFDIKELKRIVRDHVAPDKDLGHIDK